MAIYLLTIVGPDGADVDSHWASEVRLTMFGTRATSPEFLLSRVRHPTEGRERGSFRLELPDLGEVQRLRVRHDDAGARPGCYLESVEVRAAESPRSWGVVCRQWFSRYQTDGVVERTYALEARGDTNS